LRSEIHTMPQPLTGLFQDYQAQWETTPRLYLRDIFYTNEAVLGPTGKPNMGLKGGGI